MQRESRLTHFPVSFFSVVMGLAGLTIAWSKFSEIAFPELAVSVPLLALTVAVFAILLVSYGAKLALYRTAVIQELNHPIKLNFFATISISLILLSIAFLHPVPVVSRWLWMVGVGLHFVITLYVMNAWIHHEHFEVHHINPAWFIPIVGNVLVPIAGVPLGYTEISWFYFSIGILFWLVLFTIIFYRVLFHQPLPGKLMPTFFILIAPPAVGFIAYVRLTGELDAFARVLYYSGLFLTIMLLSQVRRFIRLEFFLSWWAYSFPLAAITVATVLMYELTARPPFQVLGTVLIGLVTAVIGYLLYRTARAIGARGVCVPET